MISYDPKADCAYIKLRSGRIAKSREEAPDFVTVDLDEKDNLIGVEIFNPAKISLQLISRIAKKFDVPALKGIHPAAIPRVYAYNH